MRQTTLCIPLEVKPESCSRLSAIVEDIKVREDNYQAQKKFGRLLDQVPVLHFMSMSVFPGAEYDPLFILEANFDGEPGPFWAQLESVLGDDLRAIIRCCKMPLNGDGPLYEATIDPSSKTPVAAYLERRTQRPSVFHHGNRGMTRDRILEEHALFLAIRGELDAAPSAAAPKWRSLSPQGVHDALRGQLLPAFPWLAQPPPERISLAEGAADYVRLLYFAILVLLALTVPGIIASALLSPIPYVLTWSGIVTSTLMALKPYLLLNIVLASILAVGLFLTRRGLPGKEISTPFRLSRVLVAKIPQLLLLVLVFLAVASVVLTPGVWLWLNVLHVIGSGAGASLGDFRAVFLWTFVHLILGLVSLIVVVPGLLAWLRRNELRDSSHDGVTPDERILREILHREDWITQNHMGSIVLIKPGILRSIIIRADHLGLGLLLRVKARDGYLGSMRTVHFAHWAFLNNGSRLLFFSNFDHSWGSYLDDFIEKAHAGLTLAWGCGTGFPPTRFLVYDGASHGRLFKAWALTSRTVTRFWFSAYRELTVDQIERNNRLANGLRKTQLGANEATAWCLDL